MALLLVPAYSSATAATLSGTVTGQSSGGEAKPLAEVKVTVAEAGAGEILAATGTDEKGDYSLEIPPGVTWIRKEPSVGEPDRSSGSAPETDASPFGDSNSTNGSSNSTTVTQTVRSPGPKSP